MSNHMNRITRLERELGRRTHLSSEEQNRRWSRFTMNHFKGVASPADLHGCSYIAEFYQRRLMPTDELRAQVESGQPPRLGSYEAWCTRLLMVPPGQRVPDFVLKAFEIEFEDAE